MLVVFGIFLLGVLVFVIQIAQHVKVIQAGRVSHRCDAVGQRLRWTIKQTLGQRRIMERPWGIVHIVLMWAFFVFLTSGLEMLIACLFPDFTWASLLGENVHGAMCLVQTWFAWAALLAVGFASGRRIFCRKTTHTTFDAIFILADIAVLMTAHIVCMSALIALGKTTEWASVWMPLEKWFASGLKSNAEGLYQVFSAIHLVMMAVFLCWIPRSKHLHIVFAWPDVFMAFERWFEEGRPSYSPEKVDFEAYEQACEQAETEGLEELPTIGLRAFADTTQKMRLEAFSCTKCMRCTNVCPMVQTGLDEKGPMEALSQLRTMCHKGSKNEALIPALMTQKALWSCTQCGACDRACPLAHEHVLRIMAMRQNAVAQQEGVPQKLDKCFENIERNGNPWGYPKRARLKLTAVEAMKDVGETSKPSPEKVVLFAGCMASYDKRAAKTLQAVALWLNKCGFEVEILNQETCCGEPLRRSGNEFGFEAQARQNIEALNAAKADYVLTICPHCAFTLSDSYRSFGYEGRAMHIVEFWHKLYDAKRLDVEQGDRGTAALHVPCYLSKYADEAGFIERLLKKAGYEVRQTECAERASCCGAGGARFFFTDDRKITQRRIEALDALGAQKLAVLCPFCEQMLGDALQNSSVRSLTTSFNVIDELTGCVYLLPKAR